jgi:hypothetical protein
VLVVAVAVVAVLAVAVAVAIARDGMMGSKGEGEEQLQDALLCVNSVEH